MVELPRTGPDETAARTQAPGTTGASGVAGLLQEHKDAILHSWEARVTSERHEVELVGLVLRDDIPALLDELATWLASDAEPETSPVATRALAHVVQRLDQGLPLAQLLREYRLLRETLIAEVLTAETAEQDRAGESGDAHRQARIPELARLNAGLDVLLSQSILEFVHERDRRSNVQRQNASRAVQDAQQRARKDLASFESSLRASEARFRALVTASSDVVFRMSPDWSEMRQLDRRGFLTDATPPDRPWLDRYIHPADQPYVMAVIREAIRTKDIFKLEHRVLRPDGSVGWTLSRAVPLMDERGEIYEWFGAATDFTERKRAEDELREADRRKNEFLGALSHELRNPLAPVTNSLYILEHAVPGGEQALRAQAVIRRQISHLSRLVDDLLDVTRITRNKIRLQRQRLDLGELIRQTVEDYRSQFEKADIRLELVPAPSPVPVDADANRLAQVMGNLLQNAANFTRPGGLTTVVVATEAANQWAVVRVVDTGIGLETDVMARMFEPFMQADKTLDRSRGGLGLGLALVKGLVELHGGEVSAHSAGLGQGAQIIVRLPLSATDVRPSGAEAKVPGRRATRRVLVIEDHVDAAESLRQAFMLGGHVTEVAYDGTQGLAKARTFLPEIIICDIGLPGLSGYEVARALRADQQLKGTYLVALSGYALPDDLVRAADAGFDLHLAKPASLSRLDELLRLAPRPPAAT